MSIEAKIDALFGALEANTAATKELTAAWAALTSQANSIQTGVAAGEVNKIAAGGTVVAEVKPPKPEKAAKAEKPAATPTAPETVTATPVEVAAPAPAAASPSEVTHDGSANSVTLEDVQAALKAKVSDYRTDVVATLKKYGVSKASELKADQYQLALDDLNAIGQDLA